MNVMHFFKGWTGVDATRVNLHVQRFQTQFLKKHTLKQDHNFLFNLTKINSKYLLELIKIQDNTFIPLS